MTPLLHSIEARPAAARSQADPRFTRSPAAARRRCGARYKADTGPAQPAHSRAAPRANQLRLLQRFHSSRELLAISLHRQRVEVALWRHSRLTQTTAAAAAADMKDKQKRKKERTWAEAARMVTLLLVQELPIDGGIKELLDSGVLLCLGILLTTTAAVCSNLGWAVKHQQQRNRLTAPVSFSSSREEAVFHIKTRIF